MLLRRASSPLLSSVAAASTSPSIEPPSLVSLSFSVKSKPKNNSSNISGTLSDSHLQDLFSSSSSSSSSRSRRRRRCLIPLYAQQQLEMSNSRPVSSRSMNRELLMLQSNESNTMMERSCSVTEPSTLAMGDGCAGGGGRVCNGRRGNGDGENSSDPNELADKCYKEMIKADPSNSLLLGNYARFLKEVKADCFRAVEYCERAILANPSDASVLCLYAEIIWQTTKDTSRAQTYFDRAVKAAPDDCPVMASYAHFLWELEEDEEQQEENIHQEQQNEQWPENSLSLE